MKLQETKKILISIVVFSLIYSLPYLGFATDYSSSDFVVTNPVITTGSAAATSTNFGLGQSASQAAIGKSSSSHFQVWSGFQYYFKVSPNTLTATAGAAQVSLSWTVPQTYLGAVISSYEVGVGTVSGSYTFTDVGNVTAYTVTGLNNGTQYYFKIKTKAAGGLILTYSNEATATPVASTGGGGGGGGGGGTTGATGAIVLKGLASPGSTVYVLRDGARVATSTADSSAGFDISLNNLTAGTYAISLYAEDVQGVRTSTTANFIETVTDGVIITVNNIFLAPSIGVDKAIVKQGDVINIFGYTVPDSKVTVFTHSDQQVINNVVSTGSGAWFNAFNTAVLDLGSHTTRSQSSKNGTVSAYSNTVDFSVGDTNVPVTPGQCKRSDLNCDGRVNLTDFSILLYFWQQTNPANVKVDINKSGKVDLTDFSILLFDWTG